jgi:predicted transcriptional regulator
LLSIYHVNVVFLAVLRRGDVVARSWQEVRTQLGADDERDNRVARERDALIARQSAYALADIRRRLAVTQREVAERMGVSQSRVSAIESGRNAELNTIRSYVAALGGVVEIVADFGVERIVLQGG